MNVLITPRGFANVGLEQIERMKSKGLQVQYNATGLAYSDEEFRLLAKDVDAIIVGVDTMNEEMMKACPNLKVICKFGVGTDNIDVAYAKKRGIYVGRCIGSNAKSVAEHVVAMMFMEAKNLYPSIHDVKQHGWSKPTGREISGKKIGIIGFGMIGKYLADFAYGLGMEVRAYDTCAVPEIEAEKHHAKMVSLHEIYETCDYISLHVPLLASTKHMISSEQFKMMKPTACILNTARGGIVDEEALFEALQDKEIRSACFDVYSCEPPKKDDPLLRLDNFLLTPHIAARSVEAERRTCEMSTDIILAQLLGE